MSYEENLIKNITVIENAFKASPKGKTLLKIERWLMRGILILFLIYLSFHFFAKREVVDQLRPLDLILLVFSIICVLVLFVFIRMNNNKPFFLWKIFRPSDEIVKKYIEEKRLDADVFYSVSDKKLFLITGYTNECNVFKMKEDLNYGIAKLREYDSSIDLSQVQTAYITESRRYKSMRYFYVECQEAPKGVFELGPDWTMYNWIKN